MRNCQDKESKTTAAKKPKKEGEKQGNIQVFHPFSPSAPSRLVSLKHAF
jgi:hypothetical protein